jgi:hypothetical protein
MRVLSSWHFAGSASLVTTAILLCLGAFVLSHSASGSELSAVLTMVRVPHAEQVANGLPIEGRYPVMFADEEDEGRYKLSKNAMLLRTLVLVLFYGSALGWLLFSGWRGSRFIYISDELSLPSLESSGCRALLALLQAQQ